MHLNFFKKNLAAVCLPVLVFLCMPFSAAFTMKEFDPNAGEAPEIEWETASALSGEDGFSELFGNGGKTVGGYGENETCGLSGVYENSPEEPQTLVSPLAAELCEPVENPVFSDSEELSPEAIKSIESSLRRFYEKTGVQPFLYFTQNGTEEDLRVRLREKYSALFGSDGGHFLVYFAFSGNSGGYNVQVEPGAAAETVLDYASCEYFLDCIDKCSACGFSYEDTFRTAFDHTADYVLFGTERDIFDETDGGTTQAVPFYDSAGETKNAADPEKNADTDAEKEPELLRTVSVPLVFAVCVLCTAIIIGAAVKKKKTDGSSR